MAARASRGDSVVQRLPGKLALLRPGWLERDVEATRVSGGCCTVELELVLLCMYGVEAQE